MWVSCLIYPDRSKINTPCASPFADEAFGKLFLQFGPVRFMQCVKLVNMADTVESLVNKAIT